MGFSVGPSSFDDLAGVEQFVSTAIVADQTSSLCYEFDTTFPGALERGDRLTVNEAIRSKQRQWDLRQAWNTYLRFGAPPASLAAFCTWGPPEQWTSTHREEIGTALDFGITQRDGTNRAMTADEAAWVHEHGVRRGIVWTGRTFNPQESWHHNGGYRYTVAPIPGVNRPGTTFYTTAIKEDIVSNGDNYTRIVNPANVGDSFVVGPLGVITVGDATASKLIGKGLDGNALLEVLTDSGVTSKSSKNEIVYDRSKAFWRNVAKQAGAAVL